MKELRYLFAFLLVLPFFGQEASAQFRYGYFKAGVSVGSTNYLGDLDDDFTFRFTKMGVGAHASYRFNPFMTARLEYFRGWASAADSVSGNVPRNRRDLHFRTPISEMSFQFTFDFLPTDRNYAFRPPYTPYVFAGISIFQFNPQAQLGGRWYDLQPLGTEGQWLQGAGNDYPEPYKLTQVSIPMGAGIRIALAKRWDLEIETGFRKTFTDYLDDVSSDYPDAQELRAQMGEVASILSDPSNVAAVNGIRGDDTQADWYIYTNAKLSFIIDWVKCPTFR